MNWKDNRHDTLTNFEKLKVGDVFISPDDNIIYIKITLDEGFDICNNEIGAFRQKDQVIPRKATMTLD